METVKESFRKWAIVDVMGHQRYVGLVSEHVVAGQGFIRVDMPADDETMKYTKLIGPSSIYSITPVEEAIARAMAKQLDQAPIAAYELKRLGLSAPTLGNKPQTTRDPNEDYDDCFDDEDHEDSDEPY